jgi:hypothetical protein
VLLELAVEHRELFAERPIVFARQAASEGRQGGSQTGVLCTEDRQGSAGVAGRPGELGEGHSLFLIEVRLEGAPEVIELLVRFGEASALREELHVRKRVIESLVFEVDERHMPHGFNSSASAQDVAGTGRTHQMRVDSVSPQAVRAGSLQR